MLTVSEIANYVQSMDFDHPFGLRPGNVLEFSVDGIWAPEVHHVEDSSTDIDCGSDWEPVTQGLSGQYGYRGPIMHPSEYVGPAVAQRLLDLVEQEDSPQVFCLAVVSVLDSEDAAGWTILRYKGA